MLIERAADGLDRAGSDLVALLDQLGELADDRFGGVHRVIVALQREDVAPQVDVAVEVALERAQHGVLAARQLGGDGIVELERLAHYVVRAPSASRTRAAARFPSARPPARAITSFITRPMSAGAAAPVSAIAAAMIASSSESSSSAGR